MAGEVARVALASLHLAPLQLVDLLPLFVRPCCRRRRRRRLSSDGGGRNSAHTTSTTLAPEVHHLSFRLRYVLHVCQENDGNSLEAIW